MWFNKNTGQLSQLHSHVHVTVNVSTHRTFPPSFFSSAFCTTTLIVFLWKYSSSDLNCSFFFVIMAQQWVRDHQLDRDTYFTICSYLYWTLYPHQDTTLTLMLSWCHKHLLAFGTSSLEFWILICTHFTRQTHSLWFSTCNLRSTSIEANTLTQSIKRVMMEGFSSILFVYLAVLYSCPHKP